MKKRKTPPYSYSSVKCRTLINAYKRMIKANKKQAESFLTKTLEKLKKYTRKDLNNMKISELKVLFKAKKSRFLPNMTKQEMVNTLLRSRR